MVTRLSAADMAYLFSILIGIVVSGILFFNERFKAYCVRWLALSYLFVCLTFFVIFLYRTHLIEQVPHFYRTGAIFMLTYMPLSYLFVRTALWQRAATKWDWLHAIPVLLYIADFSPLFLSSGDTKLSILALDFDRAIFNFSYGQFFSEGFYRAFLSLIPLTYWIAQVVQLIRWFAKNEPAVRNANAALVKWLLFYLAFQVMLWSPVFLFFLTGQVLPFFEISFVFTMMFSAFIAFSLFVHPGTISLASPEFVFPMFQNHMPPDVPMQLKSGFQLDASMPLNETETMNGQRHVKALEKLTKKQLNHMKYELEFFLQRNQPFLQHSYSLQQLATSLSFPLYQLSALINQEYRTNFNDLINKYRIEHALRIIKEGKNTNLNINGLADRCGFNNRNSFTNAFKKFTGLTPSEYFKDIHT